MRPLSNVTFAFAVVRGFFRGRFKVKNPLTKEFYIVTHYNTQKALFIFMRNRTWQ